MRNFACDQNGMDNSLSMVILPWMDSRSEEERVNVLLTSRSMDLDVVLSDFRSTGLDLVTVSNENGLAALRTPTADCLHPLQRNGQRRHQRSPSPKANWSKPAKFSYLHRIVEVPWKSIWRLCIARSPFDRIVMPSCILLATVRSPS